MVDPSGLLWGSERALLDLLRQIDVSRFDVRILSPSGTPFPGLLKTIGMTVAEGPIGMLHRRGPGARMKALGWIAREIHRFKPDVIHVNEAGATRVTMAARAGRRIPVISHVRLWDDAVALSARAGGRADPLCIAVSGFVAEGLRSSLDVRVVYDPFDAEAFEAEAGAGIESLKGNGIPVPTVLMVGRLCREKGQELLLDAAELIGERDMRFIIAGGVPPESPDELAYAERLAERTNRGPLRDRVAFLGNRPDVAALMKASQVVVLASDNEPFGRVLLEALSLGVPIVVPDRGGPTEIAGPDERGALFKAGNASSLAATIRDVLDNIPVHVARASLGRQWVLRECSPALHATRIQAIWTEAASRRAASG
ncbi:MAG: glycosyltransferase [Gemmatimonadaceae bacterium]